MTDAAKSFCIKPWAHTFIQPTGDFSLCCYSKEQPQYNINFHSIEQYWSGEFLQQVRGQMLSGVLPASCAKCAEVEAQGSVSLREKSNADYKIIDKFRDQILKHYQLPKPMPVDIEWVVSNLCNLKCMMCAGTHSSSLLTENKILGIENLQQREFRVADHTLDQMKSWLQTQPKLLTFHGGETMMVPEVKQLLQWGVENHLLENTEVRMITNATKFDSEWFDLLSQLNKLVLMVSVEAVGDVNEYIRYGSNWSEIDQAVGHMQQLANADVMVHSTLQNLNILHVASLIEWTQSRNILWNFDILENPTHLQLINLPSELLSLAKQRLEPHKNFKNIFRSVQTIIDVIDSAVPLNPENWNQFINYIDLKDQHRKNSIFKVIPEIEQYWHKI
jgi:sulfatase maturation enzyme AslB (radical SAM superfamily)